MFNRSNSSIQNLRLQVISTWFTIFYHVYAKLVLKEKPNCLHGSSLICTFNKYLLTPQCALALNQVFGAAKMSSRQCPPTVRKLAL